MKNIETELDILIGKEGGYTNDPLDNGGETIWGITKFVADSCGYKDSMKSMKTEAVQLAPA
jgi:lysozyme family protein